MPEEEAQAIEAMRESMAAFGNSAQVEHLESILRQAFRSAGLAGVSGVAGEAKALAGLNEKKAFAQKGGYDVHHRPDGFVSAVTGQAAEALLASGISASVPEGGPLRVYYYHCDPVGLPLALSDEAGAVCWAARHDPWGNIEEAFNADPERIEQTLRLPGQQHDKATGLYYNRHRFYDPRLGAYISQDPIGLAGGMQPYRYPHNPFGAIDPWGLQTYIINRDLQVFGDSARSRSNPITHTFAVTTNPDGSIARTYSWGNEANLKGWSIDQSLDIKTAREALNNGKAEYANIIDNACVEAAYNQLNKKENEHANRVLYFNCKSETTKLLDLAQKICNQWYPQPHIPSNFDFWGRLGN